MNPIREIKIKYFRSIHNLHLKEVGKCNVFSGKNDVGKSNIIKALNLFFNNQTDWLTDFNFQVDFNLKRLEEVRKESVKGKQYIQVEVVFNRGDRSVNTLPEVFRVQKTWDRNSKTPKEKNFLEKQFENKEINTKSFMNVQRSYTQFMNRVKFEYVPAIKDVRLFNALLNNLQYEIFDLLSKKGRSIEKDIKRISKEYTESVLKLSKDFSGSTGINTRLALPLDPDDLFRVLNVVTELNNADQNINLKYRGDGIRMRFIPSLYNFLAENHRGIYILGFEEPENSLEHGLGSKMANDFFQRYSNNAQIFLTSHSPAFLFSEEKSVECYKVYQDQDLKSQAIKLDMKEGVFSLKHTPKSSLLEELGLNQLQREFHKLYEEKLNEAKEIEKTNLRLEEEIKGYRMPILYTEGKTDVIILETAWKNLYPQVEIPFKLLSIETFYEGGGGGGVGSMNRKLDSVKPEEVLQIGLYDRDTEGINKGFKKLSNNFSELEGLSFVKKHRNGKAFAILMPTPNGKKPFADSENLCIEFLFPDEILLSSVDSKGRSMLIPFEQDVKRGNVVVDKYVSSELHLSKIDNNCKQWFAKQVVPTLPVEAFKNFEILFSAVMKILESIEE